MLCSTQVIMSSWKSRFNPTSCLRQWMKLVLFGSFIGVNLIPGVSAFAPVLKPSSFATEYLFSKSLSTGRKNGDMNISQGRMKHGGASSTSLNLLLDVPDYFFTITFPMLGILLSVSKEFGRLRLEENAWEQRLEEARAKRLREDPTLTELDLRRKEASNEWSAYGKPRKEDEERQRSMRDADEESFVGSRGRVKVLEKVIQNDDRDDNAGNRMYSMDDDEINQFEMEYGIDYDPYYDDPYAEDELPNDIKFMVDKKYGDRIYENGERFFKDKESGLFYRQGAKPRNLSFW